MILPENIRIYLLTVQKPARVGISLRKHFEPSVFVYSLALQSGKPSYLSAALVDLCGVQNEEVLDSFYTHSFYDII